MSALTSLLISTTLVWVAGAAFGPKYPVTASWFRDRFTYQEWNKTLGEFQLQDGDTVFLRAPPVIRRTRDDLARDPNFVWCGGSNSSTGVDGTRCYDEAVQELTSMGLKVVSLATYEYEEGFSETIMMCPQVDRKINSSRIYYRIVLPAGSFNQSSPYVDLYTQLGRTVHGMTGKRLAISPFIGLNRAQFNVTVEQHVQGFETLARTGQIDVIAVQEGRGVGIGCYYWPTQRHLAISQVDKTLDKILQYQNPDLKPNVTFDEMFTGSNQELFAALEKSRDGLVGRKSNQLELWLNLDAFEYLRDDPCLPVDPASSGMGELLNRASKNRLDRGLTAASVRVQKVISFAWDPDYTCSTNQYRTSLAQDIRAQFGRPMIASCSFHSPANRSVVVIGYNLEGMQQGFELYDPPYIQQLDDKGWVSVKAQNAANGCIFLYDFTRSKQQWKASHGKLRN
nr:hypothetical protein BaRGS_022823 [Batillaria attramentaria]